MALTVDEIAEILNSMRVENENNVENFEKVLTDISAKLELMAGDSEDADLIKVYLTELKGLVEDKSVDTNTRFADIEKILHNVLLCQDDVAKTSELKDLFHVFSAAFDNFTSNFVNQKDFLENLSLKLENVENKVFDKDELASLIAGLNQDLVAVNNDIEKSFVSIDEKFAEVIKKLDSFDITEQVNSINSKILNISEEINLIPSKISFASLEDKISYSQSVLNSLRELITETSEQENAIISERFEKLEKSFESIVTDSDFTGFRTNLADFVQKIIDNSTVLNTKLSYTTERIEHILTTIENLDNREEFDKVLNTVNQNAGENLDKILADIENLKTRISEEIGSNSKTYFDDLSIKIANIISEISDVKSNLEEKCDNVSEDISQNVSSAFASTKISMENVIVAMNNLNDMLKEQSEKNAETILANIDELNGKVDEFSTDIVDELRSSFSDIKTGFSSDIASNISDLKLHLGDVVESLRNYVSELNDNSETSKKVVDEKISKKLLAMETAIENCSDVYEDKMATLQVKLAEFAQNVQNTSSDVNEKISSSIEELGDIKQEIVSVQEALGEVKSSADEKTEKILMLLDENVKEILTVIENLEKSTLKDINSSINENIDLIENKFSTVLDVLEKFNSETGLAGSIEEKFSALKQEIGLVNTDITGTIQSSRDEILQNFEDIKKSFDDFSDYDFNKLMADLKILLETSFMNFSVDVNGELASSSEAIMRLEQAYKDIFNKITLIEDCVSEKLQNDIELLNITIETNSKNLQCLFEEKLDEYIGDMKSQIANMLEDTRVVDAISNTKEEINVKLDVVLDKQDNIEKNITETISNNAEDVSNKIYGNIFSLGEELKKHIKSTCDEVVEKTVDQTVKQTVEQTVEKCDTSKCEENIDILNQKVDALVLSTDKDEIINSINEFGESAEQANNVLNEKIDILVSSTDKDEILNSLDELGAKTEQANDVLNQKIDALVISTDNEEILHSLEEIEAKADKTGSDLTETLESLIARVDIIASDDSLKSDLENIAEKLDDFEENTEYFKNALDTLSNKVDIIAADNSLDMLYDKFDEFSETEDKVAEMLTALHQKVDVIAMDDNDFDIEEEIDDIKELIFEQRKYFEVASDEKANAIDKYLKDVLLKLDNVDLEKNSEDIKETIMNALVSLVDQISFVEETEEIKDFVEEKTDAIKQGLIEVQNQLRQLASPDDDFGYSYTLQDVESDIAKLRVAITHLSGNDFENLSGDIKKIVNSVEGLETTLTQEQIIGLKGNIEKLNEDILSISSRTNKILLTSDESNKALNDGLNNFGNLVEKLEDRLEYLDNTEATERLERKIESIQSMAVESANADKVFHQVMMYLGEWIDTTTENISSITEKTSEINLIKENVNDVIEKVSDIQDIKDNIEELRSAVPEKSELLSELENKFEQQEARIDRLEMKLEKILSTLEEKDDMVLNRKVDKIEKMLSRLGTNIEKLTSYVDED
ncbi:unknown [Clostridium sp. CAG:715]|nr:unknown [Clostridium sp. CAG:715]